MTRKSQESKNSWLHNMLAELQIQNNTSTRQLPPAQKAMEVNPDDAERAFAIYAQLQSQRGQAANAIGPGSNG